MIKIHTNTAQQKQLTEEKQQQLINYRNCLETIKIITGKPNLVTIDELNAEVLKGTNFKDAQKVAELKGYGTAYNYYIEHYSSFDPDDFTKNMQIKDSVLNAIEEQCTTYLNDECEQIYKELLKCTELLNKAEKTYLKCLKQDYKGEWTINTIQLNSIYNESKRKVQSFV